jgi:hypothetical protein
MPIRSNPQVQVQRLIDQISSAINIDHKNGRTKNTFAIIVPRSLLAFWLSPFRFTRLIPLSKGLLRLLS